MKKNIITSLSISFLVLFFSHTAFADTTIHLDIEASSGSIYNQDITVTECDNDNDDTTTTMATTAYCAVLQSGVTNTWSWFGSDAFLNSIDTKVNNDGGNGVYWGWFSNLDLGQTALNKYELKDGDSVLINYDISPSKITVDNTSPKVGDTIKFSITTFGYDSSWNPVWNPVTAGKIVIDADTFDLEADGTYSLVIKDITPIKAYGQVPGSLDSLPITIIPTDNGGGGGGGGGGGSTPASISIPQALAFLSLKQNTDGSFGDMLYTDWVAIALAQSGSDAKSKIINYLNTNPLVSSIITDNERHAMALMSLGINPYTGTSIDYINKIVSSFDGSQFGDSTLSNDDIFALIVLKNAGYTSTDNVIIKDVAYVVSNQSANGSWGGVDMTAAGIEALRNFTEIAGVQESITKAENYLIGNQLSDGSFGNSFSTSWVLKALSLNSSFSAQVALADKYLAGKQQTDGGLDPLTDPEENRIWSTAYAIPAVSHVSWNTIMQNFTKPVVIISGGGGGSIITSPVTPPEVKPELEKKEIIPEKKEEIKQIEIVKIPKIKSTKHKVKINKIKKIDGKNPPPFDEGSALIASTASSNMAHGLPYRVIHSISTTISYPFTWLWGKLGF